MPPGHYLIMVGIKSEYYVPQKNPVRFIEEGLEQIKRALKPKYIKYPG
jgi:hypothetical protein